MSQLSLLVQAPGFARDHEAVARATAHVGDFHYLVPMDRVVTLCQEAFATRDAGLCRFLSAFFHAETRIGLAAFFALLVEPPDLRDGTLYSSEVATAILDFYVSIRSGSVAGSLASLRYTEGSAVGPRAARTIPGSCSSAAFSMRSVRSSQRHLASELVTKPLYAGLMHCQTVDVFGRGADPVVAPDLNVSQCLGSPTAPLEKPPRTDAEFINRYVKSSAHARYSDYMQVGERKQVVYPELAYLPIERIVPVIDRILQASSSDAGLSFLMQTRHLTLQADNAADLAPTSPFLADHKIGPFITELPLETLQLIEKDADFIDDKTFRTDLIRVIGREYARRELYEDAAVCYAKTRDINLLRELICGILEQMPEHPMNGNGSDDQLSRATLLLQLIQICFLLVSVLPVVLLDALTAMLEGHPWKTPFQRAFVASIREQVLSGQTTRRMSHAFLSDPANMRLDKVTLSGIQSKELRIAADKFLLLSSHLMLSLMQMQTGSAMPKRTDKHWDMANWDRFSRIAHGGLVYRNCDAGRCAEFYTPFYDSLVQGRLTAENDGYACGGALLAIAIMFAGTSTYSEVAPLALVDAALEVIMAPRGLIATFDEEGNVPASALVQGYEALIFGYSVAIGLSSLGSGDESLTAFLATILDLPGAKHPDAIYGVLLGLGLLHLGNSEFLRAFNLSGYCVDLFGAPLLSGHPANGVQNVFSTVTARVLDYFTSKHEKIRTGAALCLALTCYKLEREADRAVEFLLDFEPRALEAPKLADKFCEGIQEAGPLALGLAYAHTNSLEVATQLVSIATRSSVEKVSFYGILMTAFVFTSPRYANDLLSMAAKSHRIACRRGAALALGYLNAGSWDPDVVAELRTLMADQVEAVRAEAVIAQALVLQNCPSRELPEPIKIEPEPPLVDRQKRVLYEEDHSKTFVARVKAYNRLLQVPASLGERAREFRAFEMASATPSSSAPEGEEKAAPMYAQEIEALMDEGFSCQKYCAQFRADIVGGLTDAKYVEATSLGVRAQMLALGILNAGGMNCSFSLRTHIGLPDDFAFVGALLFAESHTWHPLAACLGLCFRPDVCITVLPAIQDDGEIVVEPWDTTLAIPAEYNHPYPEYTRERAAASIEKYLQSARLSLHAAESHVGTTTTDDDCFSFLAQAHLTATRHFLREADSANLRTVVEGAEAKSEAAAPPAQAMTTKPTETKMDTLQTPCRLLSCQLSHVVVPTDAEVVPVAAIRQGLVVMRSAQ